MDERAEFEAWWAQESYRAKYNDDHPVKLAAIEAWQAARAQSSTQNLVEVVTAGQVHEANGGGPVYPALLTADEWFEFWDNCDNVDGESIFPEFLALAQDIEQAVLAKRVPMKTQRVTYTCPACHFSLEREE